MASALFSIARPTSFEIALAWLVKTQTIVSGDWIRQKLAIADPGRETNHTSDGSNVVCTNARTDPN
jgi:hypothetical protein